MLGRYDRKNYNAWIQWSQYIGEELIGKEMDGSCQGIGIR
jgi:hypothetical protein